MMPSERKSALLVMDVQPGIIERLPDPAGYQKQLEVVVDAARQQALPVIFVVVGFRAGHPEISPLNRSFSTLKENAAYLVDPQPTLTVQPEDVVVYKRRVSAFTGSDLEVLLRAQAINHLVLCGIATSGVVLSTLREAADKDYELTVLADLCADSDEQVHRTLLDKVFPRQASVVTAQDWLSGLETAPEAKDA